MQKPTLRMAHVGLQTHCQNGTIARYASANQNIQTQAENLTDVGVCVGFVTEKILGYVGVILWYILIVRQPQERRNK